MADDDIFREFLKTANVAWPMGGIEAPDLEKIEENELIEGDVLKITYDLYLFLDNNKPKYYMFAHNQRMANLGKMSLKAAIIKFSKLPKRRKG